jgi:hypothetical protein
MDDAALAYSPPPSAQLPRGTAEQLLYTVVLVVVLPIIVPIWITCNFSPAPWYRCATSFVSGGDLALASVFLVAAMLCEGVVKKKDIAFDAVTSLVISIVAVPIYAKARVANVDISVPPTLDYRFWLSLFSYFSAAFLTVLSQYNEATKQP